MQWYDSHCHIDDSSLDAQRDALMTSYREHQVTSLMVAGVAPKYYSKQIQVCQQYQLEYALGLHPWFIDDQYNLQLEQLEQVLISHRPCAIGECGLDKIKGASWKLQQDVFLRQVKLASEYHLPLVIHSVKAHAAILEVLKRHHVPKRGVIHGFYGSLEQAKEFVRLGFKIGIGVGICHPKNKRLINVVRNLHLEDILLETDTPFYPGFEHVSLKGIDKPKLLKVAQQVSQLKNTKLLEVANITFSESEKLFQTLD